MKKTVALILCLLAVVCALASCNFGGNDTTTTENKVSDLTDLTDKMEKLEGAIADLADKIANAEHLEVIDPANPEQPEVIDPANPEQPEVIDPVKWAEATANIPAAKGELEYAYENAMIAYGFAPDEDGWYADIWHAEYEIKRVAEVAYALTVDAIERACSVEKQDAAIEAFKAALTPENFEKIDVKIANLIAAIEADGVTYDDRWLFEVLQDAFYALPGCCEEAQRAVEDANYVYMAEELYETFVAVAYSASH